MNKLMVEPTPGIPPPPISFIVSGLQGEQKLNVAPKVLGEPLGMLPGDP